MRAVHGLLGYVVVATLLVLALQARGRVRSGRPFESAPYRAGLALVDLQVLMGVGLAVSDRLWDTGDWRSFGHVGLALAVVLLMHLGVGRARDERWAAAAYQIASRTNLAAAVLLGASAWLAVGA